MTTLFIGMPVYNGEKYIREALNSIINQTYQDWIPLISDDCSKDRTVSICEEYLIKDKRIKYYRQSKHVDASSNYKFLIDSANTEYFMWAACDDIWMCNYIEICLRNLIKNECSISFTNILNINNNDIIIRNYDKLTKINSCSKIAQIVKYLLSPEIDGKANIIYGVYRTEICNKYFNIMQKRFNFWGGDMAFVFSVLQENGIYIQDQVLFYKRIDTSDSKILIHKYRWILPIRIKKFYEYYRSMLKASRYKYYILTNIIYLFKLVLVIIYNVNMKILKFIK